jgi:two-component system phosphate regulon sensor histidine kinase PhoR
LTHLLQADSAQLLAGWNQRTRQCPAAAALDETALNATQPALLEALAALLAQTPAAPGQVPPAAPDSAAVAHGRQRAHQGFGPQDLAAEYAALRASLLAAAGGLPLREAEALHLHQSLDSLLGQALAAHAAEALQQSQQQSQQQRLRYFGFVAHKLRTPLNALSLATSVLELSFRPDAVPGPMRQVPQTLRRNVQYLDHLIEALLNGDHGHDAALGGPLQRRSLALWPMVESLLPDLQADADARGKRFVNAVPDDLQVYADARALCEALRLLAAHALANSPQGRLQFEASGLPEEPAIACEIVAIADPAAGPDAPHLKPTQTPKPSAT